MTLTEPMGIILIGLLFFVLCQMALTVGCLLWIVHSYACLMFNESRRIAGKPPVRLEKGVLPTGVYRSIAGKQGKPILAKVDKNLSNVIYHDDADFMNSLYGMPTSPTKLPDTEAAFRMNAKGK